VFGALREQPHRRGHRLVRDRLAGRAPAELTDDAATLRRLLDDLSEHPIAL
jgi:hypothetical protein